MTIHSCAETCNLSKSTPVLVAVYLADTNYTEETLFECGNCSNKDSWTIGEMLWDNNGEFLATPCCHCEAKAALVTDEDYDLDQHREDYGNYVFAVTGR